VLSGPLILGVIMNAAVLRAAYGFLVLFLAFSIRSHDLTTRLFGHTLPATWALATAIGALGAGSFAATAIGSRVRIRRPLLMQAMGLVIVAATGILACVWYSLGTVILLSLAVSIVGGLAKLAVDATIQERVDEGVRASAFAHSETFLMLAWVVGGGIGLIPFNGRLGIIVCTAGMVAAAVSAWHRAVNLRRERLRGSVTTAPRPTTAHPMTSRPGAEPGSGATTGAYPGASEVRTVELPRGTTYQRSPYVHGTPSAPAAATWWTRRRAAKAARARSNRPPATMQATVSQPTAVQPGAGSTTAQTPASEPSVGQPSRSTPGTTRVLPRTDIDQPGYHIYRPSSTTGDRGTDDDAAGA
jgi:hypothetical protein